THSDSGRRTGCRATSAGRVGWRDSAVIGVIQRVYAIVPVIAAERSTRQAHFHDVEELAVAAIDLDLAIMQQVISAADARSNFLPPAKLDSRKAARVIRRLLLVIEADTDVQCETVTDIPGILNVHGLGVLL